jgi:hypothetical protein
MGVSSTLAGVSLSADHVGRAMRTGNDARHFLRAAITRCGDVVRDLELILSVAAADDPNRATIEALIEALR